MKMFSLQNIRNIGGASPLNNGLIVSWVYAGGASVASPVTIWSENTGDVNNNITVKYNGVVAWIDKKIATVSTYVVVPIVLTSGTYPVKIKLNYDNTMHLIVNGTEALSGVGTELVTNGDMLSATGWTVGSGWAVGGGVATKIAGTTAAMSQAILTVGKAYQARYTVVTRTAGSCQIKIGSLLASAARITPGTDVLTATAGDVNLRACLPDATFAGTCNNVSCVEVKNNTTTTAIPWATVL